MIIFEDKTTLPIGEYRLEYTSDSLEEYRNGHKYVLMKFTVVGGEHNGKVVELKTVISNDNKRTNAIGNSIRNRVFTACIGKENMELFKDYQNTEVMIGKQFICTVEQKEDMFDNFNPIKNTFKGYKCVLTDEEKLEIAKYLSEKLS